MEGINHYISSRSHIGEKFGRLTLIDIAGYKERGGKRPFKALYYLCECECGNRKEILWNSLRGGDTKSCGCLQKEICKKNLTDHTKPKGVAAFNSTYKGYKLSARNRGLLFELTKEEFREISQQNCYYGGESPSNICKGHILGSDFIYNGIDRIDNTKGYIKGNVVPCCIKCNKIKLDMSLEDFENQITKIYHHYILNKDSSDTK